MRGWALALVLAQGCGGNAEVPKGPVIRVSGSDTMTQHLIPALGEGYKRVHPEVTFEVTGGGSTDGIRDLIEGKAELGASARDATPAEREQARVNGYDLESERHIVSVNVIAIAVNPGNPIDSLTYDQVIGIFCTGEIDDWSFLGQEARPIHAFTRDPASGTRAVFEDFFCGPKGIHRSVQVRSVDDIRQAITDDPAAISYLSLSEQAPKVLGLRAEAVAHTVLPSQQNVIRGSYPLYHDLYLFTGPHPSDETQGFLDWLSGPAAQDVVDEERFVPLYLRPVRMDEPRPLRETIHFEPGSSTPDQRSQARLSLLVGELRDRAGEYHHIVLEGFTDNEEPGAEVLSQARAEAVQALLEKELPGTFFEIIPRGDANPLAPNGTPFGRQQNRRVQIYFANEEKPDGTAAPVTPPG